MDYSAIVERAVSHAGDDLSLADLLWRVDELRRSIPSLGELNAALSHCRPKRIQVPVTHEAYAQALSMNRERMEQLLAGQGLSRARMERALDRFLAALQISRPEPLLR